jgi:hypothetical protein
MSEAVNEKLSKMASIYLETKFHVSGDAMLDMDHSLDDIPEDRRGSFYVADIMEGFARECVSAYIEAHKQTTLANDAQIAVLEKELGAARRMLRQTARHMHGTARARSYDMHTSADFDTCTNGWCKEAAAELKG